MQLFALAFVRARDALDLSTQDPSVREFVEVCTSFTDLLLNHASGTRCTPELLSATRRTRELHNELGYSKLAGVERLAHLLMDIGYWLDDRGGSTPADILEVYSEFVAELIAFAAAESHGEAFPRDGECAVGLHVAALETWRLVIDKAHLEELAAQDRGAVDVDALKRRARSTPIAMVDQLRVCPASRDGPRPGDERIVTADRETGSGDAVPPGREIVALERSFARSRPAIRHALFAMLLCHVEYFSSDALRRELGESVGDRVLGELSDVAEGLLDNPAVLGRPDARHNLRALLNTLSSSSLGRIVLSLANAARNHTGDDAGHSAFSEAMALASRLLVVLSRAGRDASETQDPSTNTVELGVVQLLLRQMQRDYAWLELIIDEGAATPLLSSSLRLRAREVQLFGV